MADQENNEQKVDGPFGEIELAEEEKSPETKLKDSKKSTMVESKRARELYTYNVIPRFYPECVTEA